MFTDNIGGTMGYRTLAACVEDLERTGQLVRVDCELDARLEVAAVQRRAFLKNGPALLFSRVRGCSFPMLGNLFGTMERTRYIFRHTLRRVEFLLQAKANPQQALRHPFRLAGLLPTMWHALPRTVTDGPVLQCRARLSDLPQLVSWPEDGGGYITLPQVYSEDPEQPGFFRSNLGMYRVQLSGGSFVPDKEAGMHYQIHRGLGQHHAKALERNKALPVSIWIGGPPALTLAAIMPMPESVPELPFAGVLAGHRLPVIRGEGLPVVPAEADFCIQGYLTDALKPEGPFGDHLGYYSLVHDFPVLHVQNVFHRPGAIWPFTTVGRPPQEDSVFGEFIHLLTKELVPTVFKGVHEVHAVDVAGVHPLLLAVGSERYTPYEQARKPRELLTQGLHLLGDTQTCLAKYVIIGAEEDAPGLSAYDLDSFFAHILARTDFTQDLHVLPRMTMDTLDYTGSALHEGSKMIWAAAGEPRRNLAASVPAGLFLPTMFGRACMFRAGILLCAGPAHQGPRDTPDPLMEAFASALGEQSKELEGIAWVIVVDDVDFARSGWENFLWVTFTRSDPATDSYGGGAFCHAKHWGCRGPYIIDARLKRFQAKPLEEDSEVEARIDALAVRGGPLAGIV